VFNCIKTYLGVALLFSLFVIDNHILAQQTMKTWLAQNADFYPLPYLALSLPIDLPKDAVKETHYLLFSETYGVLKHFQVVRNTNENNHCVTQIIEAYDFLDMSYSQQKKWLTCTDEKHCTTFFCRILQDTQIIKPVYGEGWEFMAANEQFTPQREDTTVSEYEWKSPDLVIQKTYARNGRINKNFCFNISEHHSQNGQIFKIVSQSYGQEYRKDSVMVQNENKLIFDRTTPKHVFSFKKDKKNRPIFIGYYNRYTGDIEPDRLDRLLVKIIYEK